MPKTKAETETKEPAAEKPATSELAVRPVVQQNKYLTLPLNEIKTIAGAMGGAGMFPDIKSANTAFVKILAGQEMGITPFQAMTNIHIINGKATLAANIMASKVKGSGKYDYKVVEGPSADGCTIEFYEVHDGKKELIGTSKFTKADATAAEVYRNPTWKKFPANMMFARAMSNGVRFYCPDVFSGNTVYTAEELGAENVDEHGGALRDDIDETVAQEPQVEVRTFQEEVEEVTPEPVEPVAEEPVTPEPVTVESKGEAVSATANEPATLTQNRRIHAIIKDKGFSDPDQVKRIVYTMAGVKSRTELTQSKADKLIETLEAADPEGLSVLANGKEVKEQNDDIPF